MICLKLSKLVLLVSFTMCFVAFIFLFLMDLLMNLLEFYEDDFDELGKEDVK